mmetsp:Transcript_29367/g.94231  ORF Transcript_29367/g.94231 Transcript_29367/m.94231 type:complete len:200 (-) Transcript_29367:1022-1621(-)
MQSAASSRSQSLRSLVPRKSACRRTMPPSSSSTLSSESAASAESAAMLVSSLLSELGDVASCGWAPSVCVASRSSCRVMELCGFETPWAWCSRCSTGDSASSMVFMSTRELPGLAPAPSTPPPTPSMASTTSAPFLAFSAGGSSSSSLTSTAHNLGGVDLPADDALTVSFVSSSSEYSSSSLERRTGAPARPASATSRL